LLLLFPSRYLSKEQTLRIFQQSGLDMPTLQQIWQLADYDKDERLSSKEFAIGLHLIVCVTKRGQWLPHSLPPELKEFLRKREKSKDAKQPLSSSAPTLILNPSVASNIASPIHSPGAVPLSAPSRSSRFSTYLQSTFPFPSSSSSPNPTCKKTRVHHERQENEDGSEEGGGDDYSYLDECSPLSSSTTREQHSAFGTATDEHNLPESLTRQSLSREENGPSSGNKAFSTLFQSVKETLEANCQSLQISLSSALNTKEESQQKLENITQEINDLQQKMKLLQEKLFQTVQTTTGYQEKVADSLKEKQRLLQQIGELEKQVAITIEENDDLSEKVSHRSSSSPVLTGFVFCLLFRLLKLKRN
jgi:uncharacterized protein YoxC